MTDTTQKSAEERLGAADPDVGLRSAFVNRESELRTVVGLTEDERRGREEDFTALVRETGVDPHGVGRELYDLEVDADVADARGRPEPSDEQRQAWFEETLAAVKSRYGADDGDELLARTNRYVKLHPRLNALLCRRGIGSRRDVALKLIHHVRQTGWGR